MDKLYQGIAFSPQTTLAANLGAADTVIKVADASVFPDAPNFATIGTDEDGETVLYAAKADGLLSGCTRGVEGVAKAWQAGAVIARNFTARDHNDLIAAVIAAQAAADAAQGAADTAQDTASAHAQDAAVHIAEDERQTWNAKQDKLTGLPGQVVGFAADGSAAPVPGWSNPNLLMNWDFRNPVNLQGQTTYSGIIYTIDRWRTTGSVILGDNGLTVTDSLFQHLENTERLIGHPLTFSVLTADNNLYFGTAKLSAPDKFVYFLNYSGFVLAYNEYWRSFQFVGNDTLVAAKLEFGTQQTLARQNSSGEWEIIDSPNYDLQYALCSLYSPTTGEWVGYRHSNPNLLDNWYFVDPINQRNVKSGDLWAGGVYGIDRWKSFDVAKTQWMAGEGILLKNGGSSIVEQHIERSRCDENAFLCFSAMMNGDVLAYTVPYKNINLYTGQTFSSDEYSVLLQIKSHETDFSLLTIRVWNLGESDVLVKAVKLELGIQQTLARKEGDVWVLNDPPPNKALELAKCQRYYRKSGAITFDTDDVVYAIIPVAIEFPVEMRAIPAITIRSFLSQEIGKVNNYISGFDFDGVLVDPIMATSKGFPALRITSGSFDAYTVGAIIYEANAEL